MYSFDVTRDDQRRIGNGVLVDVKILFGEAIIQCLSFIRMFEALGWLT